MCGIVNNSATPYPISLKFGSLVTLVRYERRDSLKRPVGRAASSGNAALIDTFSDYYYNLRIIDLDKLLQRRKAFVAAKRLHRLRRVFTALGQSFIRLRLE